ncbi:ATP-binding protein [uncultured Psychrobacter sp.]|uniref:two-component system sensor histidine kinase NtrB n=1 Tax=uncultured Psychrobacter sp. TaxID=259303 RepID=UPI00262B2F4B|nr:ATP-binding protein [uncultured Psychrobacter sp.]
MASPVAPNDASDSAFIVQHLYTAVLWVNDDLTITWLNAQAEQLLAVSRERLLGQSILTLLAPEELKKDERDSIDNLSNKPLHNHLKPYAVEQKRPICSLSERFNQAQKYQQPFIDHDHKITLQAGDIAVTIDYSVTPVVYQQQAHYIIEMWGKDRQSRISEEQRQQQQYDVARHMLRSVAHEVKNPLAGIRGAAQLLQRQFVKFSDAAAKGSQSATHDHKSADNNFKITVQKLRSYTDIIISETDRLTQLIGQLLGSNQLPNWQSINIHEPLEHVLTLVMNHYPQITLKRDYDLSLPELDADKDQLIQVFLNLINNACEAMIEQYAANDFDTACAKADDTQTDNGNAGYKPQLHIQTRVAFQHTIGSQQHKQVLQVAITDNGPGIDDALIGQIFFPMVTSRASGTGLGLSIVQDIISRHHGMIDVSSTATKNHNQHKQTQFTLYLPFNQPVLDT